LVVSLYREEHDDEQEQAAPGRYRERGGAEMKSVMRIGGSHYDPDIPPNPADGLALDEQERLQLAQAYHRAARVELPDLGVHAIMHIIVENQIEGLQFVVRAMSRLMDQGLSRYEAIHAIGSVLVEYPIRCNEQQRQELWQRRAGTLSSGGRALYGGRVGTQVRRVAARRPPLRAGDGHW